MVSRTIFLKTNNFRRIRRALLAYVRCGGLALKGLRHVRARYDVKASSEHAIYVSYFQPDILPQTSLYPCVEQLIYSMVLSKLLCKESSRWQRKQTTSSLSLT